MQETKLALAALTELKAMGPARIRWLLDTYNDPLKILEQVQRNKLDKSNLPRGVNLDLLSIWSNQSRKINLAQIQKRLETHSITLLTKQDSYWPFEDDPEPPAIMFAKGNLDLLNNLNRIGIVGTRRCSSIGRKISYQFGRELSDMGLSVVSGLAQGVDGAAHKGVLSVNGGPIAVVGSGIDQIYPKSNTSLWNQVLENGLILSENPLGSKPEKWRFPARNRLIAALSVGLVVVESHKKGGSLITVDEAIARNKTVLAVPGSILSPSNFGTNQLLLDGAVPVTNAVDVCTEVFGFNHTNIKKLSADPIQLDSISQIILDNCLAGPCHFDLLAQQLQIDLQSLMLKISDLVDQKLVSWDGSNVVVC